MKKNENKKDFNINEFDIAVKELLVLSKDCFSAETLNQLLTLSKSQLLILPEDSLFTITTTTFLALTAESDVCKSIQSTNEEDGFLSKWTENFCNLKKEFESSTLDSEDKFVLCVTIFLDALTLAAFNVMIKRLGATYNERLEVKNTLCKALPGFNEKGITSSNIIDLDIKSAIALQSVTKQIRAIIQVYDISFKNRMNEGSYLIEKIEQVQNVVDSLKEDSVDPETYMNYEKSLLRAYVLAKRIEEDTLFRSYRFSKKIESVCELLESEKDIPRLSKEMLSSKNCSYSFFEVANHIWLGLTKEVASMYKTITSPIAHFNNNHLTKRDKRVEELEKKCEKFFTENRQLIDLLDQTIQSNNKKDETQNLVRNQGKKIDELQRDHEEMNQKLDKVDTKLDNVTERFDKSFEDRLNEEINKNPSSPFCKLPKEKREKAFRFAVVYHQNNFNLSRTVKALGFNSSHKSQVRKILIKVGQYRLSSKSGKKHGHKQATREWNLTPQERQKMN